jgi:hypothetical protein
LRSPSVFSSWTGEQDEILGEKLSWRLRHGWYVLPRESGSAEDEDPIPYAINASLWTMIIASPHLNPTRKILSQAPAE